MDHIGSTSTLNHLPETGDDLVDDKQIRAFVPAPGIVEHRSHFSDTSRNIWDEVQVEQWRFVRPLGSGGFGRVHLEERIFERFPQSHPGPQLRAVKIIPEREGDLKTRQHLPEILGMAKFSKLGASFTQLFAWFQLDSNICIAMEWAPHGDLQECVEVRLAEDEAREIISQITHAVAVMHERRFLHRDLKPKNVFVFRKRPESPEWRVKLGDFGVSKRVHAAANTSWHTSIDTDCSAPEVLGLLPEFTEESSYANPVDMWSLGYLAHWLLTRQYPASRFALPRLCMSKKPILLDKMSDNGVSNDAMDFVQRLVCLEPNSRMIVEEACRHPWISQRHEASTSASEMSSMLDGIRQLGRDPVDYENGQSHHYGSSTTNYFPEARYHGRLSGVDIAPNSMDKLLTFDYPVPTEGENSSDKSGLEEALVSRKMTLSTDSFRRTKAGQARKMVDEPLLFPAATDTENRDVRLGLQKHSMEDYRLATKLINQKQELFARQPTSIQSRVDQARIAYNELKAKREAYETEIAALKAREAQLEEEHQERLRKKEEEEAATYLATTKEREAVELKTFHEDLAQEQKPNNGSTDDDSEKKTTGGEVSVPLPAIDEAHPDRDIGGYSQRSLEDISNGSTLKLSSKVPKLGFGDNVTGAHLDDPEQEVINKFRPFTDTERKRIAERIAAQAAQDKSAKLSDLTKFAKSFKLKTLIPLDLLGVLSNDPAKQEELQERAQKNYEAAKIEKPEVKPIKAVKEVQEVTEQPQISPEKPEDICYCNGSVKFGEMIACGSSFCSKKWFHVGCIGLNARPTFKWFCRACSMMDTFHGRRQEFTRPQSTWAQIASLDTSTSSKPDSVQNYSAQGSGLSKSQKRRQKNAAKRAG